MNKWLLLILSLNLLTVTSCSDREWKNPFDPKVSASTWSPGDLDFYVRRDTVELNWKNRAVIDAHYKIQRRLENGSDVFRVIDSTEQKFYFDIPEFTGSGYSYQIRSYIGDNLSDPGNIVTISPIPAGTVWWSALSDRRITAADFSDDGSFIAVIDEISVISPGNYECMVYGKTVSGEPVSWTYSINSSAASIDISPDNQSIVAGHFDGQINVWNNTGERVLSLEHFNNKTINKVQFSIDNQLILSCGSDSMLRVWDNTDGSLVWAQKHTHIVKTFDISPDNQYVISGDYSKNIYKWEMQTGAEMWNYQSGREIKVLKISPDNQKLAIGQINGNLSVLDVKTGLILWEGNHTGGMTFFLDFSLDSQKLLSAASQEWKIWSVGDGNVLIHGNTPDFIQSAIINRSGDKIALGGQFSNIFIINSDNGETELAIPVTDYVFNLRFSHNSYKLFYTESNNILCKWIINTWE